MKNAKRILLFALALVALTLVMSLSIFAEEATEETVVCEHTYDWNIVGCPKCGTVAVPDTEGGKVSTNLGYTVFFAASWQEIANNVSASSTYDVIRLTADSTASSYAQVKNKNILIDLGGHTITTAQSLASLYLYQVKGLVNGTLVHGGGRQALVCYNVDFIEDITINVTAPESKNATGLILNNNASYGASYIGAMKNVTIKGNIPNHGIEAQNAASVIGSMENVKIYSHGQAITTKANIGTMTNCVFSGDNVGLAIVQINGTFELVNCEVYGGKLAIQISGAVTGSDPAFVFGSDTKFVTSGVIFDIADDVENNPDYDFSAITSTVALLNGQLYTSIDEAVAALLASTEEVNTFALMQDLTVDEVIVINKKVNFSLGGGTYEVPVYGTNQVNKVTVPGYTVSSSTGEVFRVVEGGSLTVSGDGTLVGNASAIVADGGEVIITAGTYVGYNPQEFVSTSSCVVNNEGTYTIASEHDYDDEVGADKTTYQVDGVCNNCGYVRGVAAVDYVYYATLEEALAVAIAGGKQVVLADNVSIDGDVVWDLTGVTFNFNGLTLTVNGTLSIVGGTFTQDVSEYVAEGYCHYKNNKNLYVVAAHTWTDATCTAPKTCTACGATEGEALGHNYVAGEAAEDGSVTYTCSGCNDAYVINNSAVNGEYYLGTDKVVFNNGVLSAMGGEFTYEYNVTTGMITTNNAGIFFEVRGETIYFKGAQPLHQHVEESYVAEEQADGSVNYICQFCGNLMYTINNSALNGEYFMQGNSIVFADGVVTMQGTSYNYTYNTTTGKITVDGLPDGTLSVVDGKVWYMGRVELHQHNDVSAFITEVTEPTCTENGYTTYICQYCGPLYEEEIEATGHDWVELNTWPYPTCVSDGIVNYSCNNCGETKQETIPADLENIDHHDCSLDWETRVVATCIQIGYEKYTCNNCGKVFEIVIPADVENGHNWETNMDTYVEATCAKDGYSERTCTLCNEHVEVVLDKSIYGAHNYVADPETYVEATCKQDGYANYTCSVCGDSYEETTPANEYLHDYVSSNGGLLMTCNICNGTCLSGQLSPVDNEYDVMFVWDGTALNIWNANTNFDVYYYITVVSSENGVYVISLESTDGEDALGINGQTAVLTLVDNGGELVITAADSTVYTFESYAEVEDYNYIIEGTYESSDGSVKIQFIGGVATVSKNEAGLNLPETFEYTYNPMIGMIQADVPFMLSYSLDEDAIYIGMNPLYRVSEGGDVEEPEDIEYGDIIGTIIVETENKYGYNSNLEGAINPYYTYVADKAGQYTFFIPANLGFVSKAHEEAWLEAEADFMANTDGTYVVVILEEGESYVFTVGAATEQAWTIDVYYYAEDAHVHTEVEIPAVLPLPSNNHTGMTAGVKCSECGEVLVAPVEKVAGTSSDKNFKVNSAAMSFGEEITFIYNATHPANSDKDSMYMVFVFNGEEFYSVRGDVVSGNRYRFDFVGQKAHLLAENIEAYVYAIEDGEYVMNSHLQYSGKQYCVNQLKKSSDENFKALLCSVLNLCATTQLSVNPNTPVEELVTTMVENELGIDIPEVNVESIDSSYNVQGMSGDRTQGYDWKSGALALGGSVELKLQFVAEEVEGLVLHFDINGERTIEIDASDLTLGNDGRYSVYFQVKVLEYDKPITCTFIKDGEQVGSTLTYSVYSYIVRQYANANAAESTKNFVKAIYAYSEALKVAVFK